MLISIIIPIYNAEKNLDGCLESIARQTYKDFEVLLVDDGSKDASGAMCDNYVKNDSRFRVFHKTNGGVSSARNLAIEQSKGEWILFVDSDDYVSATFVATFVNKINEVRKDSDEYKFIVFGSYVKVEKGGGHTIKLDNLHFSKEEKDKAIKYLHVDKDAFGYTCLKIYNSRLIKENGIRFNENIALSEDLIFTLDYLKCCDDIYVIDAANYYYLVDEGALSKRKYDYIVMQKLISMTEDKFLAIIAGAESKDVILRTLVNSKFCSFINLFDAVNSKYDTKFILKEIRSIKHDASFAKLDYPKGSYWLLHLFVMDLPPFLSFIGIKMFFASKALFKRFVR